MHRVHEADLPLWDELGEALAGRPAARLLLPRLGRSEEERRQPLAPSRASASAGGAHSTPQMAAA